MMIRKLTSSLVLAAAGASPALAVTTDPLTKEVMGWDPAKVGRPQYLILSTLGGVRASCGASAQSR